MRKLTPRLRLLITAPMAIILPAGLLTFLGLKTIRILDDGFSDVTLDIIGRQQNAIHYGFGQELSLLEQQFLDSIEILADERSRMEEPMVPVAIESFELTKPLPFATALFYRREDGPLSIYRPGELSPDSPRLDEFAPEGLSRWVRVANDPLAHNAEILESLANPPPPRLYETDNPELQLRYASYADSGKRVLFGLFIYKIKRDPKYRITVGLVFDEAWMVEKILKPLINRGYIVPPIRIVGHSDKVIASNPSNQNEPFEEYSRKQFVHDVYPWWYVVFPAQPVMSFMRLYETTKQVYVPLIIAAVVIMVLAVIGAIRNLAQELTLAEMRSTFVAKVSHELRTPLGLIRLFAETLEMRRYSSEEQGRNYLQTITKESERLSHLIDNVLDFSKIEAGERSYQLRPDSIENVINAVAELLRYHAVQHGLELTMRIDPELPMIPLDRGAMEQAVWNLVSNAIKYSDEGKKIELSVRCDVGELVIEIKDEGIGISPKQQEKVFEQFFRVDDPRVQEQGGSGLGLAVVKHIVEGHGGWLTLDSQPGKGSVFGLHLPLPGGAF